MNLRAAAADQALARREIAHRLVLGEPEGASCGAVGGQVSIASRTSPSLGGEPLIINAPV